jgi:hypothetical protein
MLFLLIMERETSAELSARHNVLIKRKSELPSKGFLNGENILLEDGLTPEEENESILSSKALIKEYGQIGYVFGEGQLNMAIASQ